MRSRSVREVMRTKNVHHEYCAFFCLFNVALNARVGVEGCVEATSTNRPIVCHGCCWLLLSHMRVTLLPRDDPARNCRICKFGRTLGSVPQCMVSKSVVIRGEWDLSFGKKTKTARVGLTLQGMQRGMKWKTPERRGRRAAGQHLQNGNTV